MSTGVSSILLAHVAMLNGRIQLYEASLGLVYLHQNNIIHGDIKGVSTDGHALHSTRSVL